MFFGHPIQSTHIIIILINTILIIRAVKISVFDSTYISVLQICLRYLYIHIKREKLTVFFLSDCPISGQTKRSSPETGPETPRLWQSYV